MRLNPLDRWLYRRRSYYADVLLMGEVRQTIKQEVRCLWRGHEPSTEWRYLDEPLTCERCHRVIA